MHKITISHRTLRRLQTRIWDGVPGLSLAQAEKAALIAVEGLLIGIRPRDVEDGDESH